MSWLGNGSTASLHSNDVIVYSGGESLWVLSLPTLTWNEIWTTGETPPHGLRFHTATSLRLTPNSGEPQIEQQQQQRSKSIDSTTSTANSIGAIIVLGGEPRASYDLPEATQYGPKLNMHTLRVRDRAWAVTNCTGDVPDNRCMHTTTKLRGTTLAVYGGRPLGTAHPTNEEASPVFEDSNELRAKLTQEGFYDVFLIDANAGVWRRIMPHRGENAILQPCLWGHTAFATSVFPPRRSQSGEYRHRIDLVIQGGFDISPATSHQQELSQRARAGLTHNAFVLQPVSETQPTVLKWGLAPLFVDKASSSTSSAIPVDGEFTLHSCATTDSSREGAQPSFILGGFSMKTEDDGEIGLNPTVSCGRVSVKGNWQEGPRGQISALPALDTLSKNFKTTARPLLLYYSDQLLVLESTEKFWLLDLQEQSADEQEWAPVDTSLGSNEDVERWRIGCPMHPEFISAEEEAEADAQDEGDDNNNENGPTDEELAQQELKRQQEEDERIAAEEKALAEEREKEKEERRKAKEEKKAAKAKAKEEARLRKIGKPPKPKAGEVRGVWKALHDKKQDRLYYVNSETRKSTWKIQETSFAEPLPSDTQFDEESPEEDTSDDENFNDEIRKIDRNNNNSNNGIKRASSWREATQGETVRGYETSMMNPIYDTVQQQQQPNNAKDQNDSSIVVASGTPDRQNNGRQSLTRFLDGSTVDENTARYQSVGGTSSQNTWWNAASDARHRNEYDNSNNNQQQQTNNNNERTGSQHQQMGGKPPPAPSSSRTPISQVGPPSAAPTPSIWNEPHVDLPIDSLLKRLNNNNNVMNDDSDDQQHDMYARRKSSSSYLNNNNNKSSSKRRNSILSDLCYRSADNHSELASLLLAPDERRKKEEEERRKHQAFVEKQRELYRQQQEMMFNNKNDSESGTRTPMMEEIPWIDPAEVLDYPFDLETALLMPHATLLRARKIFINKQKDEIQIPKDRDLDVKKYLQSYTQYETMSEDEHREEKKRRHYESVSRRRQQQQNGTSPSPVPAQQQGGDFFSNPSSSTYRPRSVLDMLPSMLATGKFADFVDEQEGGAGNNNINKQSGKNNNNNNSEYARPSPLIAAEYSRTGSAADAWTESSRASTPVAAAHLEVLPEEPEESSTNIKNKSRSVSQQLPGLATHHVSKSICEMLADEEHNYY